MNEKVAQTEKTLPPVTERQSFWLVAGRLNKPNQQGYVALMSVLIIAAVVLIISVTGPLVSISNIQSSLATVKSQRSLDFIEGCVEEALLTLNETGSLPSVINLPQGSCNLTVDSQVGSNFTFTVTGALDGYNKSIQVEAVYTNTVAVTSWTQI